MLVSWLDDEPPDDELDSPATAPALPDDKPADALNALFWRF